MSIVTYVFGAGASCNALPLVKDLAGRLHQFKDVLRDEVIKIYGTNGQPYPHEYEVWPKGDFAKEFLKSLAWLAEQTNKHASIDTYAKKLFIKDDSDAKKDLYKLKATLSCYFLLEQALNPVDKRYDSFFASTLKRDTPGRPLLPEGINIITWNYDIQLEKSYYEFCDNSDTVQKDITSKKNIVRINGICGVPKVGNNKYLELCYGGFTKAFFEALLSLFEGYMRMSKEYAPQISFAWEKYGSLDGLAEIIGETTTLVITGYSFPFFNRDIDKIIFRVTEPSLERIFIQVPEQDHSGVRERFLTLCKDQTSRVRIEKKIEMLSGTDLFYIPDDMPI